VLEARGIELLEQDLVRGTQVRDLDRGGTRMGDQIDQERDAGAIAVIDARCIDGHGTRGYFGERTMRLVPHRADRGGVESPR
jgi:hypothetical protein